jgi:phage gp29-like protein
MMRLFHNIPTMFARKQQQQPISQTDPKTAALWSDQAISQMIALLTRIPEIDELLTQAGISRAFLKKLETDDEIFAALRTRREAVVATPWRFEGGNDKTAKFLTEELIPHMENIVSGAWKAVPYGYSVMEAVYKYRDDGQIGIADVAVKPLEWFDPRPDGVLRYFSPDGAYTAGVDCDQIFKFFLTRSDPTYQQPKGEALLSRLYWPWFFRFNGWRFWGQFLERFGQPLLVGKSNNTKLLADALLAAHQDAVIAVGREDSVEAINPATNGEAFEKLEQCVVRRYQKLILGQTLTSDTGTKGGGSYALGQVHAEVKEGLRRSDIRLVRKTAQAVATALCTLNGMVDDIPELVFADDAGLESERADRDVKLSGMGVKFTKNYYTDRYDLRDDDFELVEKQPIPAALDPNASADPNAKDKNNKDTNIKPVDEADAKMSFANRRVSDPKRFTPAQQLVEDQADASLKLGHQPVDTDTVRAAILAAKDPRDLADRLAQILKGLPNAEFQRTLEQSLFVADVIGYANAEGKV